MDQLPGYVSIVFILTTFAALGILLQAVKSAGLQTTPAKIFIFLLPLWIFFQAVLSLGGFYQNTTSVPPRLLLFGVFPAVLLGIIYLILFKKHFIDRMPLKLLTLVHIIRIPVEIVLLWLYLGNMVPRVMTFEGWNFDIFTGILSPIVCMIAFRGLRVNKPLLIVFNILGLVLLFNIVSIAVLSLPTPFQQLGTDQPNVAVLYFPYVWLPTIVVPVVLFAHLASLWKLIAGRDR